MQIPWEQGNLSPPEHGAGEPWGSPAQLPHGRARAGSSPALLSLSPARAGVPKLPLLPVSHSWGVTAQGVTPAPAPRETGRKECPCRPTAGSRLPLSCPGGVWLTKAESPQTQGEGVPGGRRGAGGSERLRTSGASCLTAPPAAPAAPRCHRRCSAASLREDAPAAPAAPPAPGPRRFLPGDAHTVGGWDGSDPSPVSQALDGAGRASGAGVHPWAQLQTRLPQAVLNWTRTTAVAPAPPALGTDPGPTLAHQQGSTNSLETAEATVEFPRHWEGKEEEAKCW